jgi:hypothetical protein
VSIAEASGGFVVTTSVEDERRGFGSITIRVPAIRFLQDQTDMSTITLNFTEAGAPAPRTGTLEKAWERAVDASFAVVSAVIVGAGIVLPIALMIGVGLLVAGWVRPRLGSPSS